MTESNFKKNRLTCTVTGISVRCAPKVFDKRAQTYGSAESLISNYISALGRKLLCQGKSVEEIRSMYNVVNISAPSTEFIKKYTRWAKYRKPKNINHEEKTEL